MRADFSIPLRWVLTVVLLIGLPLSAVQHSSSQLTQVGIVDVVGRPGFGQLAFARGMLLMTHTAASTVDIFDPVRRRLVAQIEGLQTPRGIAVDSSTNKVYVADAGTNSIAIIDTGEWKAVDSIRLSGSPDEVLLTADGGSLYWTDRVNRRVGLVDLRTKQNTGTAQLSGAPAQMTLDSDRGLAFVTVEDQREVVGVNPHLQIAGRFPVGGSQPTGIVYDARSKQFYVAVRSAVLALDAATGREVTRVSAAPGVDTLWLDAQSKTLFAAGNGTLTVLRILDHGISKAGDLNLDVKGQTIAYDAERQLLFVPGGFEGKSKVMIMRPRTSEQQGEDTQARLQ